MANAKGIGSRHPDPKKKGWNSHQHRGSVTRVAIPTPGQLADYTRQVRADARVPEILRAWERSNQARRPVPVPKRLGDPSVFEHVVYIIKENRTYDQVFGTLTQANGDASLCVFGREVTPNHHALAEQFVLLDNFYCNGVLSADGHAWATEGYVTDYLEKSFGGFTRSYPFAGDDPLSYAPTGFLWDNVLLHGLSFRNYGEITSQPHSLPTHVQANLRGLPHKTGKIGFKQHRDRHLEALQLPGIAGLEHAHPGSNRADAFLDEFRRSNVTDTGQPVILYLPNDHTSGKAPAVRPRRRRSPTMTWRWVESWTPFRTAAWPKTCIFVIEDDPKADSTMSTATLALSGGQSVRNGAP